MVIRNMKTFYIWPDVESTISVDDSSGPEEPIQDIRFTIKDCHQAVRVDYWSTNENVV